MAFDPLFHPFFFRIRNMGCLFRNLYLLGFFCGFGSRFADLASAEYRGNRRVRFQQRYGALETRVAPGAGRAVDRGIRDQAGRDAAPLPADFSAPDAGRRVQTSLVGHPVEGGVFDFAPVINHYLQSHLFGDIFARDNLDFPSRELTDRCLSGRRGVGAAACLASVGLLERRVDPGPVAAFRRHVADAGRRAGRPPGRPGPGKGLVLHAIARMTEHSKNYPCGTHAPRGSFAFGSDDHLIISSSARIFGT